MQQCPLVNSETQNPSLSSLALRDKDKLLKFWRPILFASQRDVKPTTPPSIIKDDSCPAVKGFSAWGAEKYFSGHTEHLAPAPLTYTLLRMKGQAFAVTATLAAADLLTPRVYGGRTALTAPQAADGQLLNLTTSHFGLPRRPRGSWQLPVCARHTARRCVKGSAEAAIPSCLGGLLRPALVMKSGGPPETWKVRVTNVAIAEML